MGDAAPAGIRNLKASDRTFVTGDIEDLNDIGVILITSHGQINPFVYDGALLIDTAAHRSLRSCDNHLWDFIYGMMQIILESASCDLPQHMILQMLDFRVKLPQLNQPFRGITVSLKYVTGFIDRKVPSVLSGYNK